MTDVTVNEISIERGVGRKHHVRVVQGIADQNEKLED